MLSDHMNIQLKQGVKILTCEPIAGTIEAETRNGEVISINAYHYSPVFRWPIPGERWMVTEENGSWYLTGIYERQNPTTPEHPDFECPGTQYVKGDIVKHEGQFWEHT